MFFFVKFSRNFFSHPRTTMTEARGSVRDLFELHPSSPFNGHRRRQSRKAKVKWGKNPFFLFSSATVSSFFFN